LYRPIYILDVPIPILSQSHLRLVVHNGMVTASLYSCSLCVRHFRQYVRVICRFFNSCNLAHTKTRRHRTMTEHATNKRTKTHL